MKKYLFMILLFFGVMMNVNAENVIQNVGTAAKESVETVYGDGKALVDTLYHDGKTVVGTVYEDAKSGFSNLYPDIKSAVMSIARGIGVAAEHVYTVLVKKYFVLGIQEFCIMLCGIFTIIFGLIGWKKSTPIGQPITYRVIMPLVFIITGVCVLCNVDYDNMFMGIINPEYGAINYILDYAKEITNPK